MPPDKGAPGGWGPTTLASVLELRPHLMGPQESEVGSCIQHRSSPISLGPVWTSGGGVVEPEGRAPKGVQGDASLVWAGRLEKRGVR